jgi:hypothetical protein
VPGKISGVDWTYASGAVICRALQKLNTARRLCCASAVPIEFCPHGRDAQSMAFLRAPGIDRCTPG